MVDSFERLTESLIGFADILVSDYDLLDYLDRLLESSTEVLGAVAGGVMLSQAQDPRRGLKLLASTDEQSRLLELFELQQQEGPCWDSYQRGEPVVEENLEHTDRWPVFTPVALERGYRSVYALPMRLRSSVIGSLNLFRDLTGPADPTEVAAAQAYADMATIGIMQERALTDARAIAAQLQGALHSRVVIEQAKGVLAERLGCELAEAFQLLRWYARNNDITLREVAAGVVAGAITAKQLAPGQRDAP